VCNTIVTTWVRAGVYEVDSPGSKALRHVEPVMPAMDGPVVLLGEGTGGFRGEGDEDVDIGEGGGGIGWIAGLMFWYPLGWM